MAVALGVLVIACSAVYIGLTRRGASPPVDYASQIVQLAIGSQPGDPSTDENAWAVMLEFVELYTAASEDVGAESAETDEHFLAVSLPNICSVLEDGEALNLVFEEDIRYARPEVFRPILAELTRRLEEKGAVDLLNSVERASLAYPPMEPFASLQSQDPIPWFNIWSEARQFVRYSHATMLIAASEGRYADAAQALRLALGFIRAAEGAPFPLYHLTSAASREMLVRGALSVIGSTRDAAPLADALEASLVRAPLIDDRDRVFLECGRLTALDYAQRVYDGRRRPNMDRLLHYEDQIEIAGLEIDSETPAAANALMVFLAPYDGTIRAIEEGFRLERAYLDDVEAGRAPTTNVMEYLDDLPPSHLVAETAIWSNLPQGMFMGVLDLGEARRDAALLSIAAERYRWDHGEYPEAIEDAVEEYLGDAAQQLVAFNEIWYRRLGPGDDPHGRRYVLCSLALPAPRGGAGKDLAVKLNLPGLVLNGAPGKAWAPAWPEEPGVCSPLNGDPKR